MSKRVCSNCHSPVREGARFCPECGTQLPPVEAFPAEGETIPIQQPTPPTPPTAPGKPPSDTTLRQTQRPLRPAPPERQVPRHDRPTLPMPQAARPQRSGPPAVEAERPLPPQRRQPEADYGTPYPPPGHYEVPQEQGYEYDFEESPRRSRLPLVLLVLVALLALGGGAIFYLQTRGGEGSPLVGGEQPTPLQRQPTVTPVGAPGDTAQDGQPLPLRDTFDSKPASGGWPDQEQDGGAFHYVDGAYQISVTPQAQILWTATTDSYRDIELAIDVTPLEGSPSDMAAGLILREQGEGESKFYAFQIRPDGTYAFRKSIGPGQWESLIDWESSAAIQQGPGQTNRLQVIARGAIFELRINDQLVNTVEDATYPEGSAGFGVSTFQQGGATSAFDNLDLRIP